MIKKLPLISLLALATLATHAFADDGTEPVVVHAAESITVTAIGAIGDEGNIEVVTLEGLHLSAQQLAVEIPAGGSIATLNITVASKVNGEVTVESSEGDLVLRGSPTAVLRAGGQRAFSFTAFAPHDGVITFRNDMGEAIAAVPYTVTLERPFRQRASVSFNDELDLHGSYGIHFESGFSLGVNLRYEAPGSEFGGSISGSYSW